MIHREVGACAEFGQPEAQFPAAGLHRGQGGFGVGQLGTGFRQSDFEIARI